MSTSKVIGGLAIAALAIAGCQGSDAFWNVQPPTAAAQELLKVRSCRSGMRSCETNAMTSADDEACEQQLRSCLQALCDHDDAGPGSGDNDGSAVGSNDDGGGQGDGGGQVLGDDGGQEAGDDGGGQGFGGGGHGSCGGGHNDAGSAPPSDDGGGSQTGDDGGGQPPVVDSGVQPPPPVVDSGTGAPPASTTTAEIQVCLDAMTVCLQSTTPPLTCASNAEICLENVQ